MTPFLVRRDGNPEWLLAVAVVSAEMDSTRVVCVTRSNRLVAVPIRELEVVAPSSEWPVVFYDPDAIDPG